MSRADAQDVNDQVAMSGTQPDRFLLQDLNSDLHAWFASRVDARRRVREACAAIVRARLDTSEGKTK